MICQNQVRCKNCNDTPYSAHVHDFKYCNCGSIAVDGGMSYLKRVGGLKGYEDMSYSIDDVIIAECRKEIKEMIKTKRNDLGILLGVFRILNKHGRLITDKMVKDKCND